MLGDGTSVFGFNGRTIIEPAGGLVAPGGGTVKAEPGHTIQLHRPGGDGGRRHALLAEGPVRLLATYQGRLAGPRTTFGTCCWFLQGLDASGKDQPPSRARDGAVSKPKALGRDVRAFQGSLSPEDKLTTTSSVRYQCALPGWGQDRNLQPRFTHEFFRRCSCRPGCIRTASPAQRMPAGRQRKGDVLGRGAYREISTTGSATWSAPWHPCRQGSCSTCQRGESRAKRFSIQRIDPKPGKRTGGKYLDPRLPFQGSERHLGGNYQARPSDRMLRSTSNANGQNSVGYRRFVPSRNHRWFSHAWPPLGSGQS